MSGENYPISPVINALATELGEIRMMILRFEEKIDTSIEKIIPADAAVQDFDLAVQSLQDMEKLAHFIGKVLPMELQVPSELLTANLLLECNRRKISEAVGHSLAPQASERVSMF